MFNNNLIINW